MNKLRMLCGLMPVVMLFGCAPTATQPQPTATAEPSAMPTPGPTEAAEELPDACAASGYTYSLSYDESVFFFSQSDMYDQYIAYADDFSETSFVAFAMIETCSVDTVEGETVGLDGVKTTVGAGGYEAVNRQEVTELDGETVTHGYYVIYLPDNSAMLIEYRYHQPSGGAMAKSVLNMLDSFEIVEKSRQAEQQTEQYAIIKGCIDESINYIQAEYLTDSDTERIAELQAQGVNTDMPNDYMVYISDGTLRTASVADDANIVLLDGDYQPVETGFNSLKECLACRPEFFFCRLVLEGDEVVKIEEIFIP